MDRDTVRAHLTGPVASVNMPFNETARSTKGCADSSTSASTVAATFRIGLTRDFLTPDGQLAFGDIGLDSLDAEPTVTYEFLREFRDEIAADQIADYDAVISLAPRWTVRSFDGVRRLTHLSKFGVGVDLVDVAACTANDVLLSNTPDGVRRPMAEGALTLALALAKQIFAKDRIVRENRWMDRVSVYGSVLNGKTFGTIGLGNIGADLMRLLGPFDLARRLACDPFCPPHRAEALGVQLVDLETLLTESNFVCVLCPLTDETRGLLGAKELARMKTTAYLINIARGPIIDQKALVDALRAGQLRGAALDVFEVEPPAPDDPLLELDNVILLPHGVGWTKEAVLGNGQGACEATLSVCRGLVPKHVVNREVLERPGLKKKLARHGIPPGGR